MICKYGMTPARRMAPMPRRCKSAAALLRSRSRMSWELTAGKCSTRWTAGCSECIRQAVGRSNHGSKNCCATTTGRQRNEQLSNHAKERMADRDISEEDIRRALDRRAGAPRVGNNGTIVVLGYATGGRILKIVLAPDQEEIVTLAWPDE